MTTIGRELDDDMASILGDADSRPDIEGTADTLGGRRQCKFPGCDSGLRGTVSKESGYCSKHRDGQASDTAPKRRRTSKSGWAEAPDVEQALIGVLGGVGYAVSFVNATDGRIIRVGVPRLAHELVELAKVDQDLRKVLTWLAMPGKYGPVMMATGAIVIPILANHGVFGRLLPDNVVPMTGTNYQYAEGS